MINGKGIKLFKVVCYESYFKIDYCDYCYNPYDECRKEDGFYEIYLPSLKQFKSLPNRISLPYWSKVKKFSIWMNIIELEIISVNKKYLWDKYQSEITKINLAFLDL